MAIISFINPKGGTGKTTTALVFAQIAAMNENKVIILDCDPNSNIDYWFQERNRENKTTPFDVEKGPGPLELIERVDELNNVYDLIILDMEGSADQIVSFAIAVSDLTLIPFKPSPMEARQCARAIHLVKQSVKLGSSNGQFKLIINRANPTIVTKEEKNLISELKENNLDHHLFKIKLVERAAYMRIFRDHILLSELTEEDDKNIKKAIKNAIDLYHAILDVLEEIM